MELYYNKYIIKSIILLMTICKYELERKYFNRFILKHISLNTNILLNLKLRRIGK